jgi:hypothetical protein
MDLHPYDTICHNMYITTIPLHLTKPSEQVKFESFNVTTLNPLEQKTKEHRVNELVNDVLKPHQLLLYGV